MKSENRPKNPRHGLRHDRHSVSMQTDHLVFCTKYRAKILTPEISVRCEEIIRSVAKDLDIKIRRMAVNLDHVHIFYVYPPKLSTSYIAMKFKGVSSRLLRKEFPELRKKVRKHLWAPSTYHGSVGQGFEVVDKYIETQRRDEEKLL
jgi:putative transposase